MFTETYDAAARTAAGKVQFLKKNPLGYWIMAMMAGIYIGIGVLLNFTIGGQLAGAPYTKTVMGLAFGVALSLVVIAGAELFTGNNLVMAAGLLQKKVTLAEVIRLWIICWAGNLAGSFLLALIYHATGLGTGALAKMSAGFVPLLMRGVLCNMLVCLAVWCGTKYQSESGKLIMIFWCLLAFITTGFEHSVANMTLLSVAMLNPAGAAVTWSGYWFNLGAVTLGNMIGGIVLVAVPYFLASLEK